MPASFSPGVSENSGCMFHIGWNELVTSQGQLK